MDKNKFKVKTGRFGSTTKEEMEQYIKKKNPKNTNRSTNTALNCIGEYLTDKQMPPLDDIETDKLPELLLEFYPNMRTKKEGDLYTVTSMKCTRSGLNRYLKSKRNIDIISDPRFIKANEIFKAMLVQAKKIGKGVVKSTIPIDDIDMKKINDYFNAVAHISKPNPKVLYQQVLFNLIYYTCRRGIENLEFMTVDHYKIVQEYDGTRYVIQNMDELDKNHREDCTEMANDGKMYQNPEAYHCPVNTYEMYISKLNPAINRLWQRPKPAKNVHYNDPVWYEARPLGRDTLEKFMKGLIKDAELFNVGYTNHSIRKTCLMTLDENGIAARHMMYLSSHKSEATVRTYANKCPEKVQRQMYGILCETVGNPAPPVAKKPRLACATVSKPPEKGDKKESEPVIEIPLDPDQPNFNLETVNLFDLDDYHDKLLVKYMEENENKVEQNQQVALQIPVEVPNTQVVTATTTNIQNVQPSMPILPRMFFPNSNVTINYNFGK